MKHSNLLFEMDADWIFENPLFELDDGRPLEIDQDSQIDNDCSQEVIVLLHLTKGYNVDYKSAFDGDLANNMAKEHTSKKDRENEYPLIGSSPHIVRTQPHSLSAYGYSIVTDVEPDDNTCVESI